MAKLEEIIHVMRVHGGKFIAMVDGQKWRISMSADGLKSYCYDNEGASIMGWQLFKGDWHELIERTDKEKLAAIKAVIQNPAIEGSLVEKQIIDILEDRA